MSNEPKIPCPTCVLCGPVWLDANRKCAPCGRTWANPDVSIWSMVPLEWWLEEGMIKEGEIPEAVKAAQARRRVVDVIRSH